MDIGIDPKRRTKDYKEMSKRITSWAYIAYLIAMLVEASVEWTSGAYHLFHKMPTLAYVDSWMTHFFHCKAKKCQVASSGSHCWVDGQSKSSTSNLITHVKRCFSTALVDVALKNPAVSVQLELSDGVQKGGLVTYSSIQYTLPQTRYASFGHLTGSLTHSLGMRLSSGLSRASILCPLSMIAGSRRSC